MSPDDPRLLTLARSLSEIAHEGQVRKGSGAPYFSHPERVAKLVGEQLGVRAAVVGYLHDVVEDTPVDFRTLAQLFPWAIVQDVRALTRNPDTFMGYPLHRLPTDDAWVPLVTDETYAQFIDRTVHEGSDTALQVKLADLHVNMTDPWVREQSGLGARYVKADAKIRTALRQRGVEPLSF